MIELLYTGRTSLGVDKILEAHNLVKLLGINVTLEHRGEDERRRQVRQEKDGGIFNEDSGWPQGRYYRPLVDNRPFCLNGRYS